MLIKELNKYDGTHGSGGGATTFLRDAATATLYGESTAHSTDRRSGSPDPAVCDQPLPLPQFFRSVCTAVCYTVDLYRRDPSVRHLHRQSNQHQVCAARHGVHSIRQQFVQVLRTFLVHVQAIVEY